MASVSSDIDAWFQTVRGSELPQINRNGLPSVATFTNMV